MAIMTTAGASIGISAVLPATNDAAGFVALTFSTIGEITDLGDGLGRQYNTVTHNPIASRQTVELKGSYTEGSLPLTMAMDTTDAGQILLIAASESDDNYAFAVTYQDGSIRYFEAKAFGYQESPGGVDSVTSASCTLNVQTQVVRVAAP